MLWLTKSPEHRQAWYWLCRTDNLYWFSRVNFIDLGQANSKIRFKMWIHLLSSLKQISMLRGITDLLTLAAFLHAAAVDALLIVFTGVCFRWPVHVRQSCVFLQPGDHAGLRDLQWARSRPHPRPRAAASVSGAGWDPGQGNTCRCECVN